MKASTCSNRRIKLLTIAVVLAHSVVAINPWLITTALNRHSPKYISTIVVALLSLSIATVVNWAAKLCSKRQSGSWLNLRWAVLYLWLILPVINLPCLPVLTQTYQLYDTSDELLTVAMFGLLLAFELFWLALLDELSFSTRPSDSVRERSLNKDSCPYHRTESHYKV